MPDPFLDVKKFQRAVRRRPEGQELSSARAEPCLEKSDSKRKVPAYMQYLRRPFHKQIEAAFSRIARQA